MKIDTTYLNRSIKALALAFKRLQEFDEEDIESDIYRSATIKEFEIVLELSGKLLRKALKNFYHSSKAVDRIYFKDLFREAGKHSILDFDEIERWLEYRDSRNSTAHDYGEYLAEETLTLIENFIKDAQNLSDRLQNYDA